MAEEFVRPGDVVPRSGIYQVTHYQHRMPHEAVICAGQKLPQCRGCGARVRYHLLRSAAPIEDDADFGAGDSAAARAR